MNILQNTIICLVLLIATCVVFDANAAVEHSQQPIINGGLPVVSPDGLHLAFTSNRNGHDDLYVIGADGSKETQLTSSAEHENVSGWSPNGEQIFYSVFNNNTSSVYTTDLDGKKQRLIVTVPGRNPVLSPDGKEIIYSTGSWTEMALFRSTLDGASRQQINDGKSIAWNTHWAPDGKRFAFTGRTDPKGELAVFVANSDGSDKRQVSQVSPDEGGAQCPVWSSDGRRLAIQVNSRLRKNSAHIWLVDVISGDSRKLAPHTEDYLDETPSWFPDGKRIAFQSNRTGRMEVWIMNVDGTNARQLTH